MTRDHWDRHDFMNDEGYNELHAQEAAYIGTATWMDGGRVVVNKNTWYCHRHGKRGFGNKPQRDWSFLLPVPFYFLVVVFLISLL